MEDVKTVEQEYIELFEENLSLLDVACDSVVNSKREAAFANFKKYGVPTNKLEDYQYTNLLPFYERDLGLDLNHVPVNVELHEAFKCDVPELNTHLIFMVNGWYYRKNLAESTLPEGVIISSFANASKEYPELIAKYYNNLAEKSDDGLVHMNTMFAQDGVFIYVPKNVVLDKPIQIINILDSSVDMLSHQRGMIIVEDNAEAKVLVCDHTRSLKHFVSNHVREIYLGSNAKLDYYVIENQHNKVTQAISTFVKQERDSVYLSDVITLHNGYTRNNTFVELAGENSEAFLYGMSFTDKNQHVDNFTFIDHAVPNCRSTELFKYVLDDTSSGVFRGRILVRKDAQKTAAFQTNNNICLSKDAVINTKPQLEIYADDVKCSHGATIGQLDEAALFYLRARGIGEEEARLLLMFAFTHEVIENVRLEPLKMRIHELVEKRFRGELSKCSGCAMCN